MPLNHAQLLELLANHLASNEQPQETDWTSPAWLLWRRRMEELNPPSQSSRLTSEADIAGAITDFEALLAMASQHQATGEIAAAMEIFEFVRSTAAPMLGPQHPVAEDATCGLIRLYRNQEVVEAADRLEHNLYVTSTQEMVDASDEDLIGYAYSAIESAGFGVGLASAGPAERLRRFLADELWPRLNQSLEAFDREVEETQMNAKTSGAGNSTSEQLSYALAATLTLVRWFPRLAPGLDTTPWRSRDWSAVAIGVIRYRESQDG